MTLTELANALVPVSLLVCGYFQFPDLMEEISAFLNSDAAGDSSIDDESPPPQQR